MDTDSFYLAMSGDSLDEIVRPEMRQAYGADKKNWLATDKFSDRTPGLFKPELVGTRGVWLTAKCYLVQNEVMKMRMINTAVRVFQRNIMIYIFNVIRVFWMLFKNKEGY